MLLKWYRDRKKKKQRQAEISRLEARLGRYRRWLKEADRSSDLAVALRADIGRTMGELVRLKAQG